MFSVSALVFGWGAQYLPEAEGKYGTEAKYQGGYWKCQVMLYLLHTCTVFIWHLTDFVNNKISQRQSRHTNPGELPEIINMTIQSADTFCWQRMAYCLYIKTNVIVV